MVHSELLQAACTVSSVPKVIDAVTVGLGSKSNRTRIVCMDVLAGILRDHSIDIFQQAHQQPFRHIAQVLSFMLTSDNVDSVLLCDSSCSHNMSHPTAAL